MHQGLQTPYSQGRKVTRHPHPQVCPDEGLATNPPRCTNEQERLVSSFGAGNRADRLRRIVAESTTRRIGRRPGRVPVAVGPFELSTSGSVDQIASPTRPRTALSIAADIRAPIGNGALWIGSALEGAREIDTIPVRPLLRFGMSHSFHAIQMSCRRVIARRATRRFFREGFRRRLGRGVSFARRTLVGAGESVVVEREPSHARRSGRRAAKCRSISADRLGAPRRRLHREPVPVAGGSRWHRRAAHRSGNSRGTFRECRTTAGCVAVVEAVCGRCVAALLVVRSAGERRYAITYQAPNASLVELSGDFDRWKPAAFDQVRPGVWETNIVAAPGTYHVNLRVNGGRWLAPPGLPQTEDDFNGSRRHSRSPLTRDAGRTSQVSPCGDDGSDAGPPDGRRRRDRVRRARRSARTDMPSLCDAHARKP